MSILPIVARELRVAARKRSTFWLRIVTALVAFVIGGMVMAMSRVFGAGTTQLGGILFSILTWLGLAVALAAGVFFTSDCLSEEKREGTLGLLFLTDLRGYDVVLGKLLATSLRGSFALLAVFPVLAITMLMGGVTGAQFWKTALALLNALLCSLAAGVLVSALSRDAQKAMAGVVLLLLGLLAGGAALDALLEKLCQRDPGPVFTLLSPGYVFAAADSWGLTRYWTGLLVNQAEICLALAFASLWIPRAWQERSRKSSATTRGWAYVWRYGDISRRARLRRKLIDGNPVLWLACRERWQSFGVWALAILAAGGFVILVATQATRSDLAGWSTLGGFFVLAIYLWAASQAGRFFVEARRTGFLELMLAAPLTVKQIVDGQWRALLRMFGLPVALLLGVHLTVMVLARDMVFAGVPVSGGNSQPLAITVATVAAAGLTVLGNLLALSWFGMWMGMTSKNNNLATLKTFAFVQIIPWFITTFGSYMLMMALMLPRLAFLGSGSSSGWMEWFPFLLTGFSTVLALGKDVGFILWARSRLYHAFREQATRTAGQPRTIVLPPLPPPIPTPPIVPAPDRSAEFSRLMGSEEPETSASREPLENPQPEKPAEAGAPAASTPPKAPAPA